MFHITHEAVHGSRALDRAWMKLSAMFDHLAEAVLSGKEEEPVDPLMIVSVPSKLLDADKKLIMAPSSVASLRSLNDPTWLDFYEMHPERVELLIRRVIVRRDYDALDMILKDRFRYPKLNAQIDTTIWDTIPNSGTRYLFRSGV